ncbi:MAG: hypothetical protein HEQ35_05500 [Gloeotrichia echinulata IR180]|jgi:hypothetical protein|nr:hypothetical protein [Gloeotrichia echinulata DEX184]
MQKMFLPLTRLVVATVTGIGLASLVIPQASLADLGQADNRPGFDSTNTNPCAGGSDGSFNMFSLIHCANLNGGQLNNNQTNTGLDTEAAGFLQKQNQRLQGQTPQSNPSVSGSQPLGNIPLEIKLPSATPTGN